MNTTPGETIAVPKPKRRWFQFSLKGLLVLVFVLCVPLAWLAAKLDHKRRERAALAALGLSPHNFRNRGFCYDWELQGLGQPPGPRWLRALFGNDVFEHVELLCFDHSVTDADLAHLQALPTLRYLYLRHAKISDAGLALIGRQRELRNLALLRVPITDANLKHLEGLTNLRGLLYVGKCKLTDACVPHFQSLTKLEVLVLDQEDFTAAGVAELQAILPNCRIIFDPLSREFPVTRADGKW